jgi:hypothetical protein
MCSAQNWPFLHRLSRECKKPWTPIVLSDVDALTFSRQSAHRWRSGCQPYAPVEPYPRKIPGTHFCLRRSRHHEHSAAGRIRSVEKSSDLIGNRTRDLLACSTVFNQLRYRVPFMTDTRGNFISADYSHTTFPRSQRLQTPFWV